MRVVVVVTETPRIAETALTTQLAEQAEKTSRLPIAWMRLHANEADAAVDPSSGPHLACQSVAELTASLQQLRYAGAEWVFVDCQLAFASVGDALTSAADTLIVPVEAHRHGIDAVSGIIGCARRFGRKLVFAVGGATPSHKASAACALALGHFGTVVPAGLLGSPTSNAELLQAVCRPSASQTSSDIIQDWAATLTRDDSTSTSCEVVRVDAADWRIRSAVSLRAGEVVTLTLSMLGRFEATVEQLVDDGALLRPRSDAARQQRLAARLAGRITTRIEAATPEPVSSSTSVEGTPVEGTPVESTPAETTPVEPAPVEPAAAEPTPVTPVTEAATPPKRRVHTLLQQVSTVPAGSDRISALNQFLTDLGGRRQRSPGRIIVVGNEKGGSGKSTLTIHLVVALLKEGFDVATVDLDHRQGSLTRYLENRRAFADRSGTTLLHPSCHTVIDGQDDELRFSNLLMELSRNRDYVVLDTPGQDQPLARLAHLFADKVITPINDSFLDLDVIARLDPDTADYVGPSHYGRVMLQAREERGSVGGSPDWIVVRNRLSTVLARNKVDMAAAVERLSEQMGFRVGPGLTERVIYRELFPFGLTLLDLREQGVGVSMSMSHVAARQELRSLMQLLLPGLATQVPLSKARASEGEPAASAGASDRELASTQIGAVFADAPRAIQHVDAG